MKISLYDNQSSLSIDKVFIQKIVEALVEKESILTDEVAIYLVTSDFISDLHDQFFQDPTPTDCISFPIDAPGEFSSSPTILGEVFVCTEIAIVYAKKYKKDPIWETIYYIVHGFLHLIGFEDEEPKKRALMRKKEQECMDYLETLGLLDFG